MNSENNIHPVFDQLLSRDQKEQQLNQKGIVLWLTGLSGSGKTTIAKQLEVALKKKGFFTKLLDGDNVRTGICRDLGFTENDRLENIRRIAEVSKLFLDAGVITINSFVSPSIHIRQSAANIIGKEDFVEIYVDTPLDVCEARDVKGLYKKARAGEIKNFTGIGAPYEVPVRPAVTVETKGKSVEESAQKILDYILPKIKYGVV